MKPSFAIAGPGKVGCALGKRLVTAGYPLVALFSRDLEKGMDAARFIGAPQSIITQEPRDLARAGLIFLCLPDDRIEEFSTRLAETTPLKPVTTIVHCSGLHPAAILASGSAAGRLSLHPLLPFADRVTASCQLEGCPFAVEGDEGRLELGEELVHAIGGRPFRLPSEAKARYHAAACVASNYLVSLTDFACRLLADCGLKEDEAIKLLAPLQQATLANLYQLGPEQALTGPIVRGDAGTVAKHLSALSASSAADQTLYRKFAEATLELSTRSGRLSQEQAEAILALLAPSKAG